MLGARFTYLADAEQTDGRLAVIDVTAHRGLEPPPHVHTREDEAMYVLEGEWTFHCGGTDTDAVPGDFIWLPRGVPHHFTMRTQDGRAVLMLTPAGLEAAFRELGDPMEDPLGAPLPPQHPPSLSEMTQLMGDHGVQFVAPPVT